MTSGELRVDREAVERAVRGLREVCGALDDIVGFARRDSIDPAQFGPLAARFGAGVAVVDVAAGLRASFERSVPVVTELADGLLEAADRVIEVDAEAARMITRAGG